MSTKNPIFELKDGSLFNHYEFEEGTEEYEKLKSFANSEFYPFFRQKVSFRASEITESLVTNKDTNSVKEDQGALLELLDLITFFDDLVYTDKVVTDSPDSSEDIDGSLFINS